MLEAVIAFPRVGHVAEESPVEGPNYFVILARTLHITAKLVNLNYCLKT